MMMMRALLRGAGYPLYNHLHRGSCKSEQIRYLCNSLSQSSSLGVEKEIYVGKYGGKLKTLRRVSISTAIVSLCGFPLIYMLGIDNSSISLVGQFAIVGTAFMTSSTSTAFLHYITGPYVLEMKEFTKENKMEDRFFEVSRVNLFGNSYHTSFKLSSIEKVNPTQHPFASFEAIDFDPRRKDSEKGKGKKSYYYVFGEDLSDKSLQQKMTIL